MSAPDQLLVVIDPVARRCDGESVRIARDVLCGGAAAKVCVPGTPEEFVRALARRGSRRLVVIGDDRALVRAVGALHHGGDLGGNALSLVPVGPRETVRLGVSLGAPPGPVTAARAVLGGVARRLDLLVDDRGGVVVGGVRIPEGTPSPEPVVAPEARFRPSGGGGPGAGTSGAGTSGSGPGASGAGASGSGPGASGASATPGPGLSGSGCSGPGASGWGPSAWGPSMWVPSMWGTCRSLVRTLVGPGAGRVPPTLGQRLRVEADGRLLADVDDPVDGVTVVARDGAAEVVVRPRAAPPRRWAARTVTVAGAGGEGYRYRADAEPTGPVPTRTWTVRPGAWTLLVPARALPADAG
ncbi:diacylglycerol kinase [Streptomyces fradiae]|uniref:diacylglycerol kinase n=1 Tax=Streptomyces fradiae TaxID=1906 RepID=UPI0036B1EE80